MRPTGIASTAGMIVGLSALASAGFSKEIITRIRPAIPSTEATPRLALPLVAAPRPDLGEIGRRRVSLNITQEDGERALNRLLRDAGLDYVIQGDLPKGAKITARLTDTTLQEALNAVADVLNLDYRLRGKVLVLTPRRIVSAPFAPHRALPPSALPTPRVIPRHPQPGVPAYPFRPNERDIWNGEEWRRRSEMDSMPIIPREIRPDGTLVPRSLPEGGTIIAPGPDGMPRIYTRPPGREAIPMPPGVQLAPPVYSIPRREVRPPRGMPDSRQELLEQMKEAPQLPAGTRRETVRLKQITVGELFRQMGLYPFPHYEPDDLFRWNRTYSHTPYRIFPSGLERIEGRAGSREIILYGRPEAIRKMRGRLQGFDTPASSPSPASSLPPHAYRQETWRLNRLTAGEMLTRLRLPEERRESRGDELRWHVLLGAGGWDPDPGLVRVQALRDGRSLRVEGRADHLDRYAEDLRRHDPLTRTESTVLSATPRVPDRRETWTLQHLTVGQLLNSLRLSPENWEREGNRVRWRMVMGMNRFEPDPGLVHAEGERESRTLHVQGRPDLLREFRERVDRMDAAPRVSSGTARTKTTIQLRHLTVRELFDRIGIPVLNAEKDRMLSWGLHSSTLPRLIRDDPLLLTGLYSIRGVSGSRTLELEGEPRAVERLAGIVSRFERVEELRSR
ncbi:MAG: hypothetical protein KY468_06775 [Armatimonadetes bacterium]|nr:hypothetical protein [Armatimonadota bacterium]